MGKYVVGGVCVCVHIQWNIPFCIFLIPSGILFFLPEKLFSFFLWCLFSEVAQSCPTLCGPMNCSLPGSCIHGIFQARVLEWIAISFSRGSSRLGTEPRSPAFQADTLPSKLPGKPWCLLASYKSSQFFVWVEMIYFTFE